ncbi:pirin family protein [Negadavirga shengliensis]|uniref:Pirin family protein n=1 Tax=Negadavirga shengliensis TaxID=1389218 RepID=A0ABV9SWS7_9BACT
MKNSVTNMIQRKIEQVSNHSLQQGFLGTGHQAAQIVGSQGFEFTDPFVVLMDDQLNLPGTEIAGGQHPHAGIEIYTLVLEGNDEIFRKGNMELMTAGKGVVHADEIKEKTQVRILQLWVSLPPEKRWTAPFLQSIDLENVPTLKAKDSVIRVYSGNAFGLSSPLVNNTPITIVDFSLAENVEVTQHIPSSYNGFIFVSEGSVFVGDTEIKANQSGWLNKSGQSGESEITYKAGNEGTRFVFYAGEPTNAPIVSHGPFVADTQDEIRGLYRAYRNGEMKHIKTHPSRHFTSKQGKTIN